MSNKEERKQIEDLLARFPDATPEQWQAIMQFGISKDIEHYLALEYHKAAEEIIQQDLEKQLIGEAEQKPLYKQVIERYNRAHGQNKKITLKQICEEMNVNYASIRAMRSRDAKRKKSR